MLVGGFMAMYMFFFMLADAQTLVEWTGAHIGLPADVGRAVVGDAMNSLRQYFRGDSIVALFTSILTGVGLALFHVPLVIPIMAITFVAVFVPYLGAIVSSAFAVLIALGAGGPQMALAALIVVLIVQNGLQGIIVGWAVGGALRIHPLVVILATVAGGIFGGILGAVLGAPVAAILVRTSARLTGKNPSEPEAAGAAG
jgi:predicted PurR-regulated permease PerM